jgi:hypothetical protein
MGMYLEQRVTVETTEEEFIKRMESRCKCKPKMADPFVLPTPGRHYIFHVRQVGHEIDEKWKGRSKRKRESEYWRPGKRRRSRPT